MEPAAAAPAEAAPKGRPTGCCWAGRTEGERGGEREPTAVTEWAGGRRAEGDGGESHNSPLSLSLSLVTKRWAAWGGEGRK